MAKIKPFRGIRPPRELVEQVASRPYDVLNSEEARAEAIVAAAPAEDRAALQAVIGKVDLLSAHAKLLIPHIQSSL